MSDSHALLAVLISGGVTLLLRALPFLAFGRHVYKRQLYLGHVLPYAIMGMLIVYCLRDVSLFEAPHGAPEFASCAVVVLLHLWRRSTLFSILCGTVCYMLLIQGVF